ncbi:hypothetical protein D3C81_1941240 [compost metagenome]
MRGPVTRFLINHLFEPGNRLLRLVLPHHRQTEQHFCLCRPFILGEDLLRIAGSLRELSLLKRNHALNQQRILMARIAA